MANLISSFQQSKIRHAINAIATGFYKSKKTAYRRLTTNSYSIQPRQVR